MEHAAGAIGASGAHGAFMTAVAVCGAAAVVLFLLLRRQASRFRESQAQLRESEERLRFALEATNEIVWDWDLVSDSIYHPRWAQFYGYPEEATPRNSHELGNFLHPEDGKAFGAMVHEIQEGKRDAMEIEHRVRTPAGEWRWMLGKARVVARDAQGHAVRIVGTCENIDERKKMLSRLQFADRMASVGTLAAGVAHEINNPLAYVIGNVGFALEALGEAPRLTSSGSAASLERLVEDCRRALREAQDGATRVRSIVRDLKVFSRSDEDRREPVDVRKVVESALHLVENEIRPLARLETKMAEVPLVLASESRLTQVFVNLLVNAAQAIREGGPESNRIEVEVGRRGSDRVAVEVRDTGSGISPEDRKRIFDPFFTTKPVGVGTGLGLAICHGIVEGLGGEIEVESEVGKGSTFRVVLPPTAELPSPPPPAETPMPAPRRARILVVDDEPLFCRTVERVLRGEHDVVALPDPCEALRRIEAGECFDIVLTDLVMPAMSGMDFHASVARVAPALAKRMLFVTGGAFTRDASAFVADHPGRVLEKPLGPDALRAAIAAELSRSPLRAERVA